MIGLFLNIATQSQRQRGSGGNYAAERCVAYRALRQAGLSESETRCHIMRSDAHFANLDVTGDAPIRIPGNRSSSAGMW